MPIALHQFTVQGAGQPGYYPAAEMARQCVDQHALQAIGGPGGGIGNGSCWAAVATVPTLAFPAPLAVNPAAPPGTGTGMAALPYAMAFGNSQMATIAANVALPGLVMPSSHAERNALIGAGANGLALYQPGGAANTAVVFVQLAPCGGCAAWLAGGGGGVANPFAAAIGGVLTLHVWYRWSYDNAGIAAWGAWQALSRANKLADINGNW